MNNYECYVENNKDISAAVTAKGIMIPSSSEAAVSEVSSLSLQLLRTSEGSLNEKDVI